MPKLHQPSSLEEATQKLEEYKNQMLKIVDKVQYLSDYYSRQFCTFVNNEFKD